MTLQVLMKTIRNKRWTRVRSRQRRQRGRRGALPIILLTKSLRRQNRLMDHKGLPISSSSNEHDKFGIMQTYDTSCIRVCIEKKFKVIRVFVQICLSRSSIGFFIIHSQIRTRSLLIVVMIVYEKGSNTLYRPARDNLVVYLHVVVQFEGFCE